MSHLIPQSAHRYLGEKFTLLFTIAVDEGVTTGDVTTRKFVLTHDRGTLEATSGIVISTGDEPNTIFASMEFDADDTAEMVPGTYPFELSLNIADQGLVVSTGLVKFDKSKSLGGS